MKKIVIVTDFQGELSDKLLNDLKRVFMDRVEVENLYLNSFKDDYKIDADTILFMLEDRVEKYKQYIKTHENVIVVSRTIKKDNLEQIKEIPKGESVLIVNDYYETSLQLTSLLYKTKYKYLNFITFHPEKTFNNINYALTPGIKENVPKGIKNIYDLGVRSLDLFTVVSIFNKLGLEEDHEILNNILIYGDELVSIENGIEEHFKNLYLKTQEFQSLLKLNNDGVGYLNEKYELVFSNKKFEDYLSLKIDKNKPLLQLLNDKYKIDLKKLKEGDIIENNSHFYYIKFEKVSLYNKKYYLLIIKDITEIKKIESTIKEKLVSTGFLARYNFSKIIYKSKVMKEIIEKAKLYSTTENNILISGESGTGKELIAQSIHNNSSRKLAPFIAINCSAIPETLFESEMFGYEKGAFTGANNSGKIGLFERANNGTIFLDEIGEISLNSQAKLLRAIEERQIMRVGGDKVINIDVRIISATNKSLLDETMEKKFRMDLYYRLNVLPLSLPPLRKRKEDIRELFRFFLNNDVEIPSKIIDILENHDFKGNIRELKNISEYYSLMKNTNSPLPEYVINYSKIPFNNDENRIELEILKILNESKIGLGKSKIFKRLKEFNITTYTFRKIMNNLEEKKFISINIGRKGCLIENKGIEYLNIN